MWLFTHVPIKVSQKGDFALVVGTNAEYSADSSGVCIESSPPGQNGRHFADDTFKRIFLNENAKISI